MLIKKILKYGYIFFVKNTLYRIKGIHLKSGVSINKKTILQGGNIIHSKVRINDSIIGFGTYIGPRSRLPRCSIGKFCSIAENVKTITATHPTRIFVSTHPAFFSTKKQSGFTFVNDSYFEESLNISEKYSVIIGNDVWIGADVTILGGVIIGDGAIIATGAVVVKDVEPYAIVGGVPAKVIRKRFSDDQIKKLLNIKWWGKDLKWIKNNSYKFKNIDVFLSENQL